MNLYFISLSMTVLANIFYHLFQKSISIDVHPLYSLAITYATALVLTSVLIPFVIPGGTSLKEQFTHASWASYALGFAIVLLELGFLLVYRAGWNMSTAALTSNVIVGIVLAATGLLLSGEHISLQKFSGILLAILSLVLMNQS